MIVVDSNGLASLYLPGEYTEGAEQWMEHDPDRAAPVLWRSQFRNILAGYRRRGKRTFEPAHALQSETENLLAGTEHEVDSRSVLEMARDSECSAYDCEFVAPAKKLCTKLVTMHGNVLRSFPGLAVALTASESG